VSGTLRGPRGATQRRGPFSVPLGLDPAARSGRASSAADAAWRQLDEGVLARALATGDEDAFRALVELETTTVLRACYRILGRLDDAEDATQETFVLAHRALGSYRGDGRPRAWLLRIATRECWRAAASRRRHHVREAPLDEGSAPAMPASDDPARDVLEAERRADVREAVAALPEPYREVVTLRFFGELSLADIATTTGRPTGTIKAQLHRGIERLRHRLGDVRP
jgi:RNA polymerase sigma-70 factor (ECF subfamily)